MSNYSSSSFSDDPNSSWSKVSDYIKSGATVLDVGCSSGNFGKVLIDNKGCVVDGVELDANDYKLAKTKLRNVFNLNIETDDLGIIKNKYDYIYFGDVIEHLVWPVATLERIKSHLSQKGCLIFSIPNMAHLLSRLMLLQGDFEYGETGLLDKTHLHFYTPNEIERIFALAGYKITYFDPVLKDLPEELIESELGKVGLRMTSEFLEFTRTSQASIYQMVGAAIPATGKIKNVLLPPSSPVDKFQILLDNTKAHYEAQLRSQKKHIKKIENYAKDAVGKYQQSLNIINEKDNEIASLKQNLIKRVARKIRRQKLVKRKG